MQLVDRDLRSFSPLNRRTWLGMLDTVSPSVRGTVSIHTNQLYDKHFRVIVASIWEGLKDETR